MTQPPHPTSAPSSSPHPAPPPSSPPAVDMLILGAGWTATTYLLPLLTHHALTHASTTRTGRPGTIPFTFSFPDDDPLDLAPYTRLPLAKTVLVTFPLRGKGASSALVAGYERAHGQTHGGDEGDGATTTPTKTAKTTHWIQLGSTGIFTSPGWNATPSLSSPSSPLNYDSTNERAVAEDELLALLGPRACVLDLAGLYGGDTRRPRDWVGRVARCKADVGRKGALHLVHGRDVARAVVGAVGGGGDGGGGWERVRGRRWIVSDLRVYDWWDLIMSWGPEGDGMEYRRWVAELMREGNVRALPRDTEALGRVLDGKDFWEAIGSWPAEGRVT